ncbi:hypothetical protein KI387_033838 [Taxus chinensis]|uniref:CST complex subunit STN1 n=1 Tax=Taxus chinensis TaxID=29808 RepID=A0AA38F593_TAXCH|nr:hypothetical protein KI387_033838 [Taxus chinensis]
MCLSHVKLMAFDLLSLQQPTSRGGPDNFWRKGRPDRKVEMVGVVVIRERKDRFLKFDVDDGTVQKPELECFAAMALAQAEETKLGRLVTVKSVLVERDPNAEILHWMDCIRLAVRCYDLPAPLPPKHNAS